MVNATKESRKMEIIDNIHSLAQQIFQLIQHQEMEITINQQTIHYKNTVKIPQNKAQKKLENMSDYTKNLSEKLGLGGYNNFQETMDQPEILFNKTMDMVTSNQLGKITNTQFKELQTQITQVILENKIQKILQEKELNELDFNEAQY
ncbi:hypothetical protein G9A89_021875 [Geosiphon pyriformis]|nr:hypothetical protein G9A89_021875 [Geosiphon pyriformis]